MKSFQLYKGRKNETPREKALRYALQDKISALKSALEHGIITEQEYQQKKFDVIRYYWEIDPKLLKVGKIIN